MVYSPNKKYKAIKANKPKDPNKKKYESLQQKTCVSMIRTMKVGEAVIFKRTK